MPEITFLHGDARKLVLQLEPQSIDLLLTDPIYDRYEDYAWLAHHRQPALKQSTNVLAFTNALHLHGALSRFPHSNPRPLAVHQQTGGTLSGDCIAKAYYLVWLGPVLQDATGIKNRYRTKNGKMPDSWISNTWPNFYNPPNQHKWTKNPQYIELVLEKFTNEGDTVFDPFAGSGLIGWMCLQMNRNYIGFEIDKETHDLGLTNLNLGFSYEAHQPREMGMFA